MSLSQPGILAPLPSQSRYMEFMLAPGADALAVLRGFASRPFDTDAVIGLGSGLLGGLALPIEGLRPFPGLHSAAGDIPSTQADLWLWQRGDDRGRIFHLARAFAQLVAPAFRCARVVDGFIFDGGRDLTGYEDGTENPEGDSASAAAILSAAGPGRDGSSFVAVQQWRHDFDVFEAFAEGTRDDIIGRRLQDNVELDDAPASAHVKRTAQESFTPEAFVLRRSMPWVNGDGAGLMFVAFGKSFDAFEAQLRRMAGEDDQICDALFRFTRPMSGSYFWCPPVVAGKLDFSALGL
ncbi:MAG: Dyp-type peroxidase [Proteobacteria bacterium]|nr:Dyp-type peroxidase [Pseudomonadota bacterium]MDA1354728.1 Dyp-type peroxidase [Pseudomonadota bacterium]